MLIFYENVCYNFFVNGMPSIYYFNIIQMKEEMAMKLNIQRFEGENAKLVINQQAFTQALAQVREANMLMNSAFSNNMETFAKELHADVWADGVAVEWRSNSFDPQINEQLELIKDQYDEIYRAFDETLDGLCARLKVSKKVSRGHGVKSETPNTSVITNAFDNGDEGRRTYSGSAAQATIDELTSTLGPSRTHLQSAVSKIGIYDESGHVQSVVNSAIEAINESFSQFSTKISNQMDEVMNMNDEQYAEFAQSVNITVS